MKSLSARWGSLALLLALVAASPAAYAKRTGMNLPCHNCHEGSAHPEINVALSAPRVDPGQSVTITVTAKHPTAKVGGVLVDSHEKGSFELIDTVGTHLFENSMTQVTHAMPKPYQDGQVQFAFKWNAPAMSGAFTFDAWTNAANDNLMPADDSAEGTLFGVGVGCDGAWYYLDADQDGEGPELGKVFSCTPMAGYITKGGDCADNDPKVNSAAVEVCNLTDDNCNGMIDEGFTPTLLVSDRDGDGFGAPDGLTMFGCPPMAGYSTTLDDCDDRNPAVNPKATEVANGVDDNCDKVVDNVQTPTPTPTTPTAMPTTPTPAPTTPTGSPAPTTTDSSGCSVVAVPTSGGSWFGALSALTALLALSGRRSRAKRESGQAASPSQ